MAISIRPEHLKRYKAIAQLVWKYGHSDLLAESGLDKALDVNDYPARSESVTEAEELAHDLEQMGPIYIKMGQVLSSRPDLLPATYVHALERLQNKLEPFPFAEVKQILE